MTEPATVEARVAAGRAARKRSPRAQLASWSAAPDRSHPGELLAAQDVRRVQELLPIRYDRMLASEFAFFRGAAAVMAADLAGSTVSGLDVQCCGDAHLANFGGFASPERDLVFDVNDFDETLPGPWEWDLKRLVASFEIAARHRSVDDALRARIVAGAARSYREAMSAFAAQRNLDVWYARLDVAGIVERWQTQVSAQTMKRLNRTAAKARTKDSLRAFNRLTRRVGSEIRLVSDPPLVIPIDEWEHAGEAERARAVIAQAFDSYRESLQSDRRRLLEGFRIVDLAHKVVGVGSVGTRCWIVLLLGKDDDDPLFLQIKEAGSSVLEQFGGLRGTPDGGGRRVVEGQRVLQAASDIFLGWIHVSGFEDRPLDFYVRQLWDAKVSADLEVMEPEVMRVYGEMCGWTLARAHARSGDRIAIAAYLGGSDRADRALRDFASEYADQNARDCEAVRAQRRV